MESTIWRPDGPAASAAHAYAHADDARGPPPARSCGTPPAVLLHQVLACHSHHVTLGTPSTPAFVTRPPPRLCLHHLPAHVPAPPPPVSHARPRPCPPPPLGADAGLHGADAHVDHNTQHLGLCGRGLGPDVPPPAGPLPGLGPRHAVLAAPVLAQQASRAPPSSGRPPPARRRCQRRAHSSDGARRPSRGAARRAASRSVRATSPPPPPPLSVLQGGYHARPSAGRVPVPLLPKLGRSVGAHAEERAHPGGMGSRQGPAARAGRCAAC